MLGAALERLYGVDLTIGPVIDEGFYYDSSLGDRTGTLRPEELPPLVREMEAVVKAAHPFERAEVSKAEALAMFEENSFKVSDLLRACELLSLRSTCLPDELGRVRACARAVGDGRGRGHEQWAG